MIKIKISIEGNSDVILTPKQFRELYWNTVKMVDWGTGGAYGDGEKITNSREMKSAVEAIKKLSVFFKK